MRNRALFVFSFILVIFTLYACSVKDGRDGVDGKNANQTELALSTGGCVICHTKETTDMAAGVHIFKASGFIPGNGADCAKCHQPDLDYTYVSANATSGLSCTSCHELNGDVKFNPIHSSYAVTADNCMKCHGDISSHWSGNVAYAHYFPYAKNIAAAYGAVGANVSSHANASGKALKEGEPRACGLCHSGTVNVNIVQKVSPRKITPVTVGAVAMFRTSGGGNEAIYGKFKAQYASEASKLHLESPGADSIGCDSCHKPHSLELITDNLTNDGTLTGTVIASAEFALCTSCHNVNVDIAANGRTAVLSAIYSGIIGTDGALLGATPADFEHHGVDFTGTGNHTILDTHFKGSLYSKYAISGNTVTVADATPLAVAGYNINPQGKNACTNCHDAHGSSVFTPTKDSKDYAALATSWGKSGHSSQTVFSNPTCIPCHQSRKFATAVNTFANKADAQKAIALVAASPQVGCLTCHEGTTTNEDGANIITAGNAKILRKITDNSSFQNAFNMPMTKALFDEINTNYPANDIMLCAGCHAGGRGGQVTNAFFDNVTAQTISVPSGHVTAFGVFSGVIFDLTENLYAGKSYGAMGPSSAHKSFIQTNGCVSCHATDSVNHGFQIYTGDPVAMQLTNPNMDNGKGQKCSDCHVNGNVAALNIDGNNALQVRAVQAVLKQIVVTGATVNVSAITVEADRRKVGMALGNLSALLNDSGAYSHMTKTVVRQLVYDNIVAIQTYIGLPNFATNMSFTGVTKFSGTSTAGAAITDPDNITKANAYFTGFLR